MSHRHQRKERLCLNCGAEVVGRFCHDCGQENAEPKDTVWHLVQHFFSDLTHFDGKVWHTLKFLISKPGFLSKEYIKGRRAKYVNPVSLYFFTSAIFFLVFSPVINEQLIKKGQGTSQAADKLDSTTFQSIVNQLTHGRKISRNQMKISIDTSTLTLGGERYRSRAEYDSLMKTRKKPDNWLMRSMFHKLFDGSEKYESESAFGIALMEKFIHSLPNMLFVLLPLFALVLKLLYIRRKQFYYVDHMIFTLHLYVFTFIAMMVIFGINKLNGFIHWDIFTFVNIILSFGIFYYFYKALRNFYQQSWFKTVMKFLILNFFFLIITLVLFALFFFLSIMQL